MTSSVTRSSRSSTKKLNGTDNSLQKVVKTASFKKKKQRSNKKDTDLKKHQQDNDEEEEQPSEEEVKQNELLLSGKAAEHPEYQKMMGQLDQSYNERLQKIEAWRNFERQSILDWFAAQKKQAYDDFHFARMKMRSDLVQKVQNKITRLKQEMSSLNRQSKTQTLPNSEDYQDWVPPDRLYAIGSFVGGATNEEIDRDLMHAKQPYNGTPHLVYSDYESKSTTDTAEEEEKTASSSTSMSDHHPQQQQQEQRYLPPINHPNYTTNHSTNISYPPYEFEETPQTSRDWWPYRSTTTTA